ncbi:MAG: HlyC/CorC family transporter [Acidimicrobiia bacterium]|nr:HlyC/CorC family transporter [Acidimicrobiia bacterium]
MTDGAMLGIAGVVVLVLSAGVLAMAETSLTHLGRARARALEEEEVAGARLLSQMLDNREQYLNPVLLLVLICHLSSATIIAVLADHRWGLQGVLGALAVEIIVVFVVAEAAPKTWALQAPSRSAVVAAPLVRTLAGFPPLRWVTGLLVGIARLLVPGRTRVQGPAVSEGELLAFAGVAAEESVIDSDEQELIESIIEFGDTVVREVMVPRPDMVTVSADYRVADVMEIVVMNGFSRIPAYGNGIDDVVGIAYAKDLMRADLDQRSNDPVRTVLRPAHFVPESKHVASLLREMQAEQYHIAIVVDEYGAAAGLVTLEDLIEELVGEIVDEFDVEDPMIEPLAGGNVRVNARLAVDELNELLGAHLPEGDWDTVGGLVFDMLGHVPVEGEAVEVDGFRLRADKVQGRRIGRVRVERIPVPTPEPAEHS